MTEGYTPFEAIAHRAGGYNCHAKERVRIICTRRIDLVVLQCSLHRMISMIVAMHESASMVVDSRLG